MEQLLQGSKLKLFLANIGRGVIGVFFPYYFTGEEERWPGELEMLPFFSFITSDVIPDGMLIESERLFSFDRNYYQSKYSDSYPKQMRALEHFVWSGVRVGNAPREGVQLQFSPNEYLKKHPSLQNPVVRPLQHFLVFKGRDEITNFPSQYLKRELYFRTGGPELALVRNILTKVYHYLAFAFVLFAGYCFSTTLLSREKPLSVSKRFVLSLLFLGLFGIAARVGVLAIAYTLKFPLTGENARLLFPAHSLYALVSGLGLGLWLESLFSLKSK